ncbi:Integral membrane protein TerC family protein [Neomoorella glycerini]|uniref:Integral membrane protein TerC family protein n=1 Tax=Neomoorella glycerini TaxID=55779 RepID=A0A6I5ZSS6_9FIRM|nr:TerC family protein [Moorella glycerini]QGP93153.1 Integral membrane protein TerC family protein [Moorella glycerini]
MGEALTYVGSFLWAVLAIVIIDLALSGDNAAVIGLAIKDLPVEQRKTAAVIGAGGAVVLRVVFTVIATLLLKIRYLSAIGGVILLFITWKLIKQEEEEEKEEKVASNTLFWNAVATIIVADLSMAFDNVMGVAGAAHGNVGLVIFGLALSIPILVTGSTWLAGLMNKYPLIIYVGAGVLAHTALKMIFHDGGLALAEYVGVVAAAAIPVLAGIMVVAWGVVEIKKKSRGDRTAFSRDP